MRALLLCLLLSSAAYADVITTKDGARHGGQILDTTDAGYVLRFEDGVARLIRFEQVDAVQRDERPPADAPLMGVAATLVPRSNRGAAIIVELANVRDELHDTRMFWPIAGIVAGVAVALASVFLVADRSSTTEMRVVGGVGIAGGAALLGGSLYLRTKRSEQRDALDARIAALKREARALGFVVPRDDDD